MFHTIIIGVAPGGDGSADALALARRLAAPEATTVLTAVVAGGRPAREEADDLLQELTADMPGAHTEVKTGGNPAAGLHEAAVRHQADLIVVGSCHRGPLGRILAGNDARATMHDAPCAVALAPRGYEAPDGPFATIGVGYDGGAEAGAAIATARALAAETGAAVRALAVVPIPGGGGGLGYYGGEAIDLQVKDFEKAVAELDGITGEVVVGSVPRELALMAEGVDLLVLGSRHHTAIGRVMIGSTADELAQASPRPLLLVPVAGATATPAGSGRGQTGA